MKKYNGKERRSSESIAEKKRQQDFMRLAVVMHDSSDAIIIQDMDGRITSWNKGAEKMYGYNAEEAQGMNIDQLVPPNKLAEQKEFFKRLTAGEPVNSFETHRVAKDGTVLDVWLTVTRVPEEPTDSIISTGQEVVSSGGFAMLERNITARKRAEEQLRKLNSFLDSVIGNIPDMIFIKDTKDLQFVRLNRAGEELLGYSEADLLGKSDYDFFPKDQADFFTHNDREVLLGKKLVDILEEPIQTRNKGVRIMHTQKVPIMDVNGEPVYLLGISEDITERKQAEDKLKQSLIGTMNVLSRTVELRDPYTAGHQRRVASLAKVIAEKLELPNNMINDIETSALIHDIGKIGIPAEILTKPGKLSPIERSLVEVHAETGFSILKDSGLPEPVAKIVHQHHERIDGSGYPRGLRGEEILMEANIIAVADVVEAMSSHRPYRPSLGVDAALAEITKNKGILYNAAVADACLAVFKEGYEFKN